MQKETQIRLKQGHKSFGPLKKVWENTALNEYLEVTGFINQFNPTKIKRYAVWAVSSLDKRR